MIDILLPLVTAPRALDIALLAVSIASLVPALLFILSYGTFFPWRDHAAGRSVMYLVISLAAMFSLSVVLRVFGPEYIGREVVTLVVFSVVCATLWLLLGTLWLYHQKLPAWLRPRSSDSPEPTAPITEEDPK